MDSRSQRLHPHGRIGWVNTASLSCITSPITCPIHIACIDCRLGCKERFGSRTSSCSRWRRSQWVGRKGLEDKEVTSKDNWIRLAKHTNTTRITMFMIITSPNMGFHIMTHFLKHSQNSLQTIFKPEQSFQVSTIDNWPQCASEVRINLTYER